jgi:hypothetical protein
VVLGDSFKNWEFSALILFSIYAIVLGIIFRTGHFRRGVQRVYFNRGLPGISRNMAFAFVPTGIAFLLLVVGGTLASLPVVLCGLVALIVALWWMFRPPEWAKPAWVREHERAEAAGEPVPDYRPPSMSGRAYLLNWIGLGIGAAVWLALGLPVGSLLIGLGFGISLLLASRPRALS